MIAPLTHSTALKGLEIKHRQESVAERRETMFSAVQQLPPGLQTAVAVYPNCCTQMYSILNFIYCLWCKTQSVIKDKGVCAVRLIVTVDVLPEGFKLRSDILHWQERWTCGKLDI